VVSTPFGRRVWCICWPNLSFYRVFGSVTMSSSYWFSVLGWMMSGLSLPIVSFFSSFFSLYSRESKCMSSFLLVFQFHFLCFFIVYFHSWPFYNFFMFLIFFLNYNLSYIIFSNSGLAFQFHPSTLDLLGIEFHSFFICSASNLMTRVTSLKT
jgi:hypothetical protein